jgi:hypothetical protein
LIPRVLLLAALAFPAAATIPRSAAAKAEFKRAQPCPATGAARGACPGWVVDHVVPLCAGGADAARNMQWQTTAAAKAKDRDEHAQCRALRRLR